MIKKSFKDNPALNFITTPDREPAPQPEAPQGGVAETARPDHYRQELAISSDCKSADLHGPNLIAPPPMKPNPLYVETRSRRLQLLLQPSLHQRLKSRAQQNAQSLNDLIHSILDDWASRQSG